MMHLHKLRQTFSSTRDDLDKILHRKFRVLHPQGAGELNMLLLACQGLWPVAVTFAS